MQRVRTEIGELVILTPRERSVASLVIRGRENKEIAWELQISEYTVKEHLRRIMRELGVHSRVDLCRWILSRPLSLTGQASAVNMHSEGCTCGSLYCSAMGLAEQAVC